MSEDWKHLGEVARARRKELKLTQPDIAERGGPSAALVRQVENGRYEADMQASVRRSYEVALEWTVGSIDRVLVWGEASPLQDTGDLPRPTTSLEVVNRAQVEFERAISHFVLAETEFNGAMREFARGELVADGNGNPTAVEVASYIAWSAAHDARDWTRYEMALVEYVFEDARDPRNGSLYADIQEFRERVRRLAPERISEMDQGKGGGGNGAGSTAQISQADELSAAPDELDQVAAKTGQIEQPGEFNI